MASFSSLTGLPLLLFLLLLSLIPCLVSAQDLLASLDYGTFQGAYSSTYNISYWQKIPFAQPPIGPLRFRGPQPPLPLSLNGNSSTSTVYNSTQTFDMCPQRTVNGSEDCLYLGLYSRPWTAGQALRPVVVVFYGGAYIEGSASFGIPPSAYPVLNVSVTETDLVFVYANYRTNAFGFLPGREIGEDRGGSDLNPGLLDQDAAIKCEYFSICFSKQNAVSLRGTKKLFSALSVKRSDALRIVNSYTPSRFAHTAILLTQIPRDKQIHIRLRRRSQLHLHMGPIRRRRLRGRPIHRPCRPSLSSQTLHPRPRQQSLLGQDVQLRRAPSPSHLRPLLNARRVRYGRRGESGVSKEC